MPAKILFIVTSVAKVPGKDINIGFWLPEFADPYFLLSPKYELVVASPKGGATIPDPTSIQLSAQDANAVKFLNEKKDVYQNTQKLSSFLGKADEFDAVYVVGGHGPMFDLASDSESQTLIAEFWEKGKIVAADCAGVGSLANVRLSSGDHILKGKKVTGFSKAEVDVLGFGDVVPFLLEDKLQEESDGYEKADAVWEAHVVRSGRLITGQNPASAAGVAEAILEALA
ncbi:class I glutamine amidotransferase-like protein [Thozetella sp. PMI_491]|nr:class I glutamine amidotransferase-like protein [Thozetella sp. PMI_491]